MTSQDLKQELSMSDHMIERLKEEIECVHMYLDDLQIPRKDIHGEEYSLVGRIKFKH